MVRFRRLYESTTTYRLPSITHPGRTHSSSRQGFEPACCPPPTSLDIKIRRTIHRQRSRVWYTLRQTVSFDTYGTIKSYTQYQSLRELEDYGIQKGTRREFESSASDLRLVGWWRWARAEVEVSNLTFYLQPLRRC